ncbi:superoxide dismutase [Geothrix limicola]|uniref:superoxide dismutase n=1 Tax=Geothrix limicola TaxID=2927978 RepID=A0ABQ5QBT9_9BACT|nr:Fe-Mn family superoxide dismutase [Geothrix limicola]GLH72280.1 superoxide dismutase [Geothrix limicola]
MEVTRRKALELLVGGGAAAATLALGGGELKLPDPQASSPAPPPTLTPKPLPFAPARLKGLSEKLIVSHHDNNYAGAVKNLNAVRAELAKATKDAPGFLVGGLRAKELAYANSMTLHEAYFGNLGGDGKADGPVSKALAATWGSLGAWEQSFRALGMSLAGGSGWAILDLHLPSGELRLSWAGDHSQTLAAGLPLLVMDMYEHAYQMDYGAAAAKYIEAFFQNVNWDEVNHRYERALKAQVVLRA